MDLFPPRERGWSVKRPSGKTTDDVSPARAGMVPSGIRELIAEYRFPRASGDGPSPDTIRRKGSRFPPRERGWSLIFD